MASNVTFQSRNVLSKKFMVKKEVSSWLSALLFAGIPSSASYVIWLVPLITSLSSLFDHLFLQESLDNISLFSIITILSFFLLAPVALFVEGVKFTPAYLQSAVRTSKKPKKKTQKKNLAFRIARSKNLVLFF